MPDTLFCSKLRTICLVSYVSGVFCEKYHKYYLQQQFTVGPIQINILIKMHYYMYMATIAHTL